MRKLETTRLQIDVEKELFRRAKAIAAIGGRSLTEVVHDLLDEYVEEYENKWFLEVSAKKLGKIYEAQENGTPLNKNELKLMTHFNTLYEGLEKAAKK